MFQEVMHIQFEKSVTDKLIYTPPPVSVDELFSINKEIILGDALFKNKPPPLLTFPPFVILNP